MIIRTVSSPSLRHAAQQAQHLVGLAGVSTEVGSSRIRKRCSQVELLQDLELLLLAGRRARDRRVERHPERHPRPGTPSSAARSLLQSMTAGTIGRDMTRFSATVMRGHQREVLVDHADAERVRLARVARSRPPAPSTSTAPRVGLVEAHDALDQRRSCRRRSRPAARGRCRARPRSETSSSAVNDAEALGHADGGQAQRLAARGRARAAFMAALSRKAAEVATAPNTPPCILTIFERRRVVAEVGGAAAVLEQQALEAAVVGLAHGGVDADVGGDAGQDEVVDAALCAGSGRGRWRRTSPCRACR